MDLSYQNKIALYVYFFTLGFECLMYGNQNEVASILSYTSIHQQLSFNLTNYVKFVCYQSMLFGFTFSKFSFMGIQTSILTNVFQIPI
jgi:hypothetical protein